MATKKQPAGKQLPVKWDEELAKEAEASAAMESSTATGQFFGLKAGVLTWQDAPVPGNEMAVIIVDSVLENVYYEGAYEADTPQSPMCFAFGRDEKTLTPHKLVWEAGNQQCGANKLCDGCEWNEFGSAEKGKGKACRNTRRLGMIPAGSFDKQGKFTLIEDEEHYASTALGYMKLPVTSVKGYAGYVKQIAGALRRPPHGLITKVSVVPDPKSQFRVLFEALMNVPDEFMGTIMQRNKEAKAVIEFPYTAVSVDEAPKKGSRAAKQPPATKGRRKY